MKLSSVFTALTLSAAASSSVSAAKIAECVTNCDFDSDCQAGLLCADQHEKELMDAGYDVRKAYCGNVGKSYSEVCYDPKKIGVVDPLPVKPHKPKGKILGLCEADCDLDIDCAAGLYCADQHGMELKAAGLDPNFANCPMGDYPSTYEVCFDPKILKKSGGGGGDPHFHTYDGFQYNYHGKCDLVMARSTTFGGSNVGLDLHIRTDIVADWSLISNAALRIGDDVFELLNDGTFLFNGEPDIELPLKMMNHYEITMTQDIVNVTTLLGEQLELPRYFYQIQLDGKDRKILMNVFKQMISVKVEAVLDGTEGMLGVHGVDGLVSRDRVSVFTDPNEMGSEWQVRDSEPKLFQDMNRSPQYPQTCILPVVNARRLRVSDFDKKQASIACADVDERMFAFCVEDVLLTGDSELAHAYGMAF